jgi:hypothetical protein
MLESIGYHFGNFFDSIGDFFGGITDWMNETLDCGAPYIAIATVVVCAVLGIYFA